MVKRQLIRLVQNSFAKEKPHFRALLIFIKGIVTPDWKGLQMVSLDRFEV
jgi:hypothetical protein